MSTTRPDEMTTEAGSGSAAAHAGAGANPRDRRRDPRYELHGTQGMLYSGSDGIPCHLIDISLSGCCLRTETSFEPGALAPVEVMLPLLGIQVRVCGITQWAGRDGRLGVRFIHQSARAKGELASLLTGFVDKSAAEVVKEAVSSAHIQKNVLMLSKGVTLLPHERDELFRRLPNPIHPAPVPPATPQPIQVTGPHPAHPLPADPPLEKLEAQQNPTPPSEQTQAKPAPEPAPQSNAIPSAPTVEPDCPSAPDRLNQPNQLSQPDSPIAPHAEANPASLPAHPPDPPAPGQSPAVDDPGLRIQNESEEEWPARIIVLATGIELSGALVDLTLSGCTLRMPGACALSLHGRVEVEFHLLGLSFRIAGYAARARNMHAVEIRFAEISQRRRNELLQVLDELAG